jgi:23S rRNA (adenine2503-C2)-methyltransferase
MISHVSDHDPRPSLLALDREGLGSLMARLDQPAYRARQIWRWLYVALATDVAQMTDLPLSLRERLAATTRLGSLRELSRQEADDGLATKFLFGLPDGQSIETVLMHYLDPADEEEVTPGEVPHGSHTVCFSTQVGCAMGCVFCATGQMGLVRDLDRGECLEQLLVCARHLRQHGERLSRVVFMGMGEPLANWPATRGVIETLVDPDGLALSPRRLTVSTVGLVPGIHRLAELGLPVRLAVSLHAADDALRSELVAVNRVYPLDEVLDACRAYQRALGRRITFEYVLIRGVNDSIGQATDLARRLRDFNGHVNLIPLNPTAGSPMRPSRYDDAAAFADRLRAEGLPTTLRMRRGIEIQAGCGQLRARDGEGLVGRTIPLLTRS